MLFNSPEFAVFLLVTLVVYHVLGGARWRLQNAYLLVASYFFYGWWDPRFLVLILISTGVDFVCGLKIEASDDRRVRRRWLLVSCTTNLGILGFFKYFDFFIESASSALALLGFEPNKWVLRVLLPPGISFYTFQTLSYTIDVYRRQLPARRDPLSFALFVAYFPQLVAGPIERARRLLPQIEKPRPQVTRQAAQSGLTLILLGLFKKIVIADLIASVSDAAFEAPGNTSSAFMLSGVYAFAIQVYCDFSAYSDIARGTSRLLGIELVKNFETPYLSRNIADFWQRWHISLSNWFRDYVFFPLSTQGRLRGRVYPCLAITWTLVGLWHGAAWHFVFWGSYQAVLIIAHRMSRPLLNRVKTPTAATRRAWAFACWFLTFNLVCFGLLFFRAESIVDAWRGLSSLAALRGGFDFDTQVLWAMGGMLFLDLGQRKWNDHAWPLRLHPFARNVLIQVLLLGILLAIATLSQEPPKPFIYFQF